MQKIKIKWNKLYVSASKKWDKKTIFLQMLDIILKTEIDSIDFKNEISTTKRRQKNYIF